eukprot:5405732-Pyramimonas_sp.AAC.1
MREVRLDKAIPTALAQGQLMEHVRAGNFKFVAQAMNTFTCTCEPRLHVRTPSSQDACASTIAMWLAAE